jgi:hypothetical protein
LALTTPEACLETTHPPLLLHLLLLLLLLLGLLLLGLLLLWLNPLARLLLLPPVPTLLR